MTENAPYAIALRTNTVPHYYVGGGLISLHSNDAAFIIGNQYGGPKMRFLPDSAKAVRWYRREKAEEVAFRMAMDEKELLGKLYIEEFHFDFSGKKPVEGELRVEIKLNVDRNDGTTKI